MQLSDPNSDVILLTGNNLLSRLTDSCIKT